MVAPQESQATTGGREAVYLQQTKREVNAAATNAQTLKDKFNEIQTLAEKAKAGFQKRVEDTKTGLDPRAIERPLDGEAGDGSSLRHNAKTTETYVKEVLILYKDRSRPQLIPPNLPPASRAVLDKVCGEIQSVDIIDATSAPYIYTFLHKLINGQITNSADLKKAYEDIVTLNEYGNTALLRKMRKACIDATVEGGIPQGEAEKLFLDTDILTGRAGRRETGETTYEERLTHEALRKSIYDKLRIAEVPGGVLTDPVERALIHRYMNLGIEAMGPELEAVFRKIGVSPEEYMRYHTLSEKAFANQNYREIRGMMTNKNLIEDLDNATHAFTLDSLRELGIITPATETIGTGENAIVRETGKLHFDKKAFKRLINKYYYLALADIHHDSSKDWSKAFDPYQHGYYFGGIKGLVTNLCNGMNKNLEFDESMESMTSFFDDVKGRYQASILTYAEIFHNLPLYARDASSFEKWGAFLGYLFPSELSEVFDPDDPTMEIARRTISLHLRRRIAQNGNKIPSDLFSGKYDTEGARYGQADREAIKKSIAARVKVATGKVPEDWELERAVTYSLGIGISNLMDPEIIATADPDTLNFKGIYPLVSVLSAKHNWGLGRGQPKSGLFPDLLAMDVSLYPEERSLGQKLMHKKDWVPKAFHEMAIGQQASYGEEVFDRFLDRDHKYQDLLNMINIGTSLNSRHGWRLSPLRDLARDYLKEGKWANTPLNLGAASEADNTKGWTNKEWRQYMDFCTHLYGTSSMWWAIDDRVNGELKRVLSKRMGYDMMENQFEEYLLGEKALKRDFYFDRNGQLLPEGEKSGEGYSFGEVRIMRDNAARGEAFMVYLKRNPGDFLMLLSQLSPQLLDEGTNYFQSEASLVSGMRSAGKHEKDIEKAREIHKILLARWGDEGMQTMRNVREWILKVSRIEKDGKKLGVKGAVEYISNHSADAFERMMKSGTQDEVEGGKLKTVGSRRDSLIAEDFRPMDGDPLSEQQLRDLFMGEGGLMGLFNSREDFGGFDEVTHMFRRGEGGFFTHMGSLWTMKEGMINPFAADINHYEVYQHLGEVGEDIIKRLLGDAQMVSQMIQKVGKLDELLLEAANSGDMGKIFELHSLVFTTLKNIMSKEYAQKANYIMSQLVANFFKEHSDLRKVPGVPFPIRMLQGALLGNDISLSRVITHNRHAQSMDTNAVRTYFRKLGHELQVIPIEGMWSIEQLDEALDADTAAFMAGEEGPNFIYFLSLFLLWTYIKKALEESSGKKGK